MEKTPNTFAKLNTDISDFVLTGDTMRMAKNIRVVSLDSATFAVTNIKGTEQKFTLRDGHIPLAIKNYNEILYILSMHSVDGTYEFGSYPSPDYENQAVGVPAALPSQYDTYRPFNNLLDTEYFIDVWDKRLTFDDKWNYAATDNVKIEIQPEYDGSVNCVIFSRGNPPRIVNSAFSKNSDSDLIILESRSGTANSNTYTLSSLENETKLILRSIKVLGIDFNDIVGGGQLKFGNYQYLFAYQTEDFSSTEVVGESSICQVFSGNTIDAMRGGDQDEATNKQIRLDLTNLDTDFKYLKVFFRYSSGTDVVFTQYLELTRPIEITGTSMTFAHTGFEETSEISIDDLNIDSSVIEGANTGTQIGGYLLIGGITGASFDYTDYTTAAQSITHSIGTKAIPAAGSMSSEGYSIPGNTYNYLGYMGGETYPFGIRFIMNDGSISSVFPIAGGDYINSIFSADNLVTKGLIRFPGLSTNPFHSQGQIQVRHPIFNLSTFIADNPDIVTDTIGFFFVRGERRPDMIMQALSVPTYRMPPLEYLPSGEYPNRQYYHNENFSEDDFSNVPIVDGMMEAYRRDITNSDTDQSVVDPLDNTVKDGYMPIYMLEPNSYNPGYYTTKFYDDYRWALFSGDAIVDEPAYIGRLQAGKLYWKNHAKFKFRIKDAIPDKFETYPSQASQVGMWYDFDSVDTWYSNPLDTPVYITHVPEESFSGEKFISKVHCWVNETVHEVVAFGTNRFKRLANHNDDDNRIYTSYRDDGNDEAYSYDIHMNYGSYFGMFFSTDGITPNGIKHADTLSGASRPIGANLRYYDGFSQKLKRSHTLGTYFPNITQQYVNAGLLGNIYPQEGPIPDINNKYTHIEGVSYRQVSPRYTWADVSPTNTVEVYGGDCYISKIHRRIARSGFNDATAPLDIKNIHMGQIISWYQESKHNLYLRSVYQADITESTSRNFFPHKSGGNAIPYRSYRLKETERYSQGYSETIRTKTGVKIDEAAVFIKSDLYSRVAHSSKHVPNSYKNGYREFSGINYVDYDVEMGRIVHMDNYRNLMQVVFEHGIAVGEINQRIQTGSGASGAIFVEPGQILPPTLGFMSKEIGTQHSKSVVRAASGLFGVDAERRKIWRVQDNLRVISDQTVSSWLEKVGITNPVTGYNPKYNEVLFSSDSWTLCWNEGQEEFVSFYSFVPSMYASPGRDLYSIKDGIGYQHDSDNSMEIYGNLEDCYVEFVVNTHPTATKVFDYLNIISNEVKPAKVEFFTFTGENKHLDTLVLAGTGQYSKVLDEVNLLTGFDKIRFRDKKFVVQIPNAEIYNSLLDNWNVGGRMRNKYLIVRITYNTEDKLQLLNTITDFRFSAS